MSKMSKKVDILVTACSTPHVPSPSLIPSKSKSHQYLQPEDQINLHPITIVKSKSDYKTSKRVIQPLIEPLEEVYSVSFHRKPTENSRFSRRRSTLMTVLDSQESSRRESRTLDFKHVLNKRRSSFPKTNHRSGHAGQQASENVLESTQEELKSIRKPLKSKPIIHFRVLTRCLKIKIKVSFNSASETSYDYI